MILSQEMSGELEYHSAVQISKNTNFNAAWVHPPQDIPLFGNNFLKAHSEENMTKINKTKKPDQSYARFSKTIKFPSRYPCCCMM